MEIETYDDKSGLISRLTKLALYFSGIFTSKPAPPVYCSKEADRPRGCVTF